MGLSNSKRFAYFVCMAQNETLSALRRWRETEAKTQGACAAKVGTTRQVWSDWERGRRVPSKSFMPKVVALTGGVVQAGDFYPQLDQAA